MKLLKLTAFQQDYDNPAAAALDAYHLLAGAECVIYYKQGITAPPEDSPQWRKPPWNRPGDMAISCLVPITCHIYRDEHPLLARLQDLAWNQDNPRLRREGAEPILSEQDRAFIASRVQVAKHYVSPR